MPEFSDSDFTGSAFYRLKDDTEAVQALIRLARMNDEHARGRRALAAKYASLYEGMNLTSLAPYGYSSDATHYFRDNNIDIPLIRNTCNGLIETFVSWIGSLDKPKPDMMTTKGKWSDKRKAEKMKRFVQAGYTDRQGRFTDTYQMCRHGLRLAAAATGSVAVKVIGYPNEKKVSHELHDTLTMFFDYGELNHSGFLTLGETTWFDPERLMEIYPGNDDLIVKNMKPPPLEFNLLGTIGKVKKLVPLYEGWRCTTAGKPGMYLAGLEDGSCLARDEYDYESPPFAWLVLNPHLWGPLGVPITHYVYESCRRDNLILATIDRSVMKTPKSRTIAVEANITVPGSLEAIEDNQVVYVHDMEQAPHFENNPGFHPAQLELANQHRADAFQDSGVPEGKAGSKAEDGLPSAIGQRNVAAFFNKRFAAGQTDYVQWTAVDIAELDIRALREVAKADPKFTRKWPGGKYLVELTAEDGLDLEDDKYVLQNEAVGGSKNTPAERAQFALELFQQGVLSKEGYALASQDYDTPGAIDDITPEKEWLDEQMYKWAFATDDEAKKPDFYQSPLKFVGLEAMLTRTIGGLLRAQMDELEPERQEFFMMFLSDLDAAIKAKAAFVQSLTAPPAGAPQMLAGTPGAPPPGAAPLPPPPA